METEDKAQALQEASERHRLAVAGALVVEGKVDGAAGCIADTMDSTEAEAAAPVEPLHNYTGSRARSRTNSARTATTEVRIEAVAKGHLNCSASGVYCGCHGDSPALRSRHFQ